MTEPSFLPSFWILPALALLVLRLAGRSDVPLMLAMGPTAALFVEHLGADLEAQVFWAMLVSTVSICTLILLGGRGDQRSQFPNMPHVGMVLHISRFSQHRNVVLLIEDEQWTATLCTQHRCLPGLYVVTASIEHHLLLQPLSIHWSPASPQAMPPATSKSSNLNS